MNTVIAPPIEAGTPRAHWTRAWQGIALLAVAVVVVTSCSPPAAKSRPPLVGSGPTLTVPPKGGSTSTTPTSTTASPTSQPQTTVTVPQTTVPAITATTTPRVRPVDFSRYMANQSYLPASSASEPTGNFRIRCQFSHLGYNDPIVFPGQTGAAHLHMFAGNRATDAASTFDSLRATTANSTCNGGPANQSAYWMPAVQDATGNVMVPDFFDIYYVSNTGAGPYYQGLVRSVRPMPAGLKMIAGYDMADPASASNKKFNWYCEVTQNKSQSIPDCPAGEQVGVVLPFPSCWNGRDLDSPNHRDHMAYLVTDDNNRTGCPISHPVLLPEVGFQAWFTHDGNSSDWHLSSDRMPGMTHANGSTFHADWFGAWDPTIQSTWTRNCINGMLNCQDGQLGDGKRMIGLQSYPGPFAIPAPARP